jgi:hypothetical protein
MRRIDRVDDPPYLVNRQDRWYPPGALASQQNKLSEMILRDSVLQHLGIKEYQRAQGLVLR